MNLNENGYNQCCIFLGSHRSTKISDRACALHNINFKQLLWPGMYVVIAHGGDASHLDYPTLCGFQSFFPVPVSPGNKIYHNVSQETCRALTLLRHSRLNKICF